MKKEYIKPTIEAYKLKTRSSMLTTSTTSVSSDDYNDGILSSREGFFGGDDEE